MSSQLKRCLTCQQRAAKRLPERSRMSLCAPSLLGAHATPQQAWLLRSRTDCSKHPSLTIRMQAHLFPEVLQPFV